MKVHQKVHGKDKENCYKQFVERPNELNRSLGMDLPVRDTILTKEEEKWEYWV